MAEVKDWIWLWVAVVITTALVIGGGLYILLPAAYFALYPFVCLYFLIVGVLFLDALNRWIRRGLNHIFKAYIRFRAIQFFATVILLFAALLLFEQHLPKASIYSFMAVTFGYYILLMVVQTISYSKLTKHILNKKKNE